MSIELHIEQLVIDEAVLAGERSDRITAVIQHELSMHLASSSATKTLGDIGAVAIWPLVALSGMPSSRGDLGARVAAAVGKSLGLERGGDHEAPMGLWSVGQGYRPEGARR